MAIWQCNIYLVPFEGEKLYYDEDFVKSLYEMKAFLPKEESWSKSINQYGMIDSTCLEFIVEGNTINEIHLRIDLRSITENDLNMICAFAQKNRLWVNKDEALIKPDYQNLINILRDSNAARFLKSPETYFANLPTESELQREIEEKYGDLFEIR